MFKFEILLPSPYKLVAVTTPTLRFGDPVSPYAVADALAVLAVPVRFPTKLVAVITPETLIPDAVKIPTGDNNCDLV
jgi:hypothetical protein